MQKKTPNYVRKAQKNYEQKIQRKTVVLNIENDKKIIEKLEKEETPFSELMKKLIKKHYNIE